MTKIPDEKVATINQILATIEHHLDRAKRAVKVHDPSVLESAGEEISGLGDMLRDAL